MMTNQRPTLHDVARQAGVSIATVSYVLNGRRLDNKPINETTRQRVMQVVADLGYMPNQSARHLRRQSTERICVVLPQLGIPYYEALCRDIESVAEQYGYTVLLALAPSYEKEQKLLAQRALADGIILVHGQSSSAELAQLAKTGTALVAFSNLVRGHQFDVVRTTEEEAFYQAVCYLIEKGHRRIAFLTASKEGDPTQNTSFLAYQRALQDQSIALDERLIVRTERSHRKEAYQSARELFQRSDRPDAVFTGSDVAAIATIWAARDTGLRVPQDVAVIGAGNIPEGEINSPPLTTIGPTSLDFKDVGALMFSRLQQPDSPGRIHLCPWELIVRESV